MHHLNQVDDKSTNHQGRIDISGYNLSAAITARAAGAYQAARRYLNHAISLLPKNAWNDHYDLTLTLYNEICEINYLTGDHDNADKSYNTILKHAKTPLDKIRAYETKITIFTGSNHPADAINLSIEALHMLGMRFPKKASKLGIAIGSDKSKMAPAR